MYSYIYGFIVSKIRGSQFVVSATEMQWKNGQEFGTDNYMMPPMGPAGFNPYWNGMQPGMEAYMPPFGGPMPFMPGYPLGPMDMGYGGFMPPDPYAAPGLMYPPLHPQHPHQRSAFLLVFDYDMLYLIRFICPIPIE